MMSHACSSAVANSSKAHLSTDFMHLLNLIFTSSSNSISSHYLVFTFLLQPDARSPRAPALRALAHPASQEQVATAQDLELKPAPSLRVSSWPAVTESSEKGRGLAWTAGMAERRHLMEKNETVALRAASGRWVVVTVADADSHTAGPEGQVKT